jgi:hypothetical protein
MPRIPMTRPHLERGLTQQTWKLCVGMGEEGLCAYRYFPDDTSYAVLFREMVTINTEM